MTRMQCLLLTYLGDGAWNRKRIITLSEVLKFNQIVSA